MMTAQDAVSICGAPGKMSQRNVEFVRWLSMVHVAQPKIILEIGSMHGWSLWGMAQVLREPTVLISIDNGRLGQIATNELGTDQYRESLMPHDFYFLNMNSRDKACVAKLEEILDGRNVDLLFIDGDHKYRGVRADYLNYRKFVNKGIIGFHDIAPRTMGRMCQVPRLWEEIRDDYPHIEIFGDPKDTLGIGILFVAEGSHK